MFLYVEHGMHGHLHFIIRRILGIGTRFHQFCYLICKALIPKLVSRRQQEFGCLDNYPSHPHR